MGWSCAHRESDLHYQEDEYAPAGRCVFTCSACRAATLKITDPQKQRSAETILGLDHRQTCRYYFGPN